MMTVDGCTVLIIIDLATLIIDMDGMCDHARDTVVGFVVIMESYYSTTV